jgi:glycosyltransferase involved in cell wall biosynthesis
VNENQQSLYEDTFADKIQKAVHTLRPDIIHSHHLWIVTSIAKKTFPKLPIVTSCHGSDLRQFRKCPGIAQKIVGEIKDLHAVFSLSQSQKSEIQSLYNIPSNRIHITGAGYNQELFSFATKPDPNPIQIVYAGKLSRSKGVPWFLKALSKIQKQNWLLHLVGGGDGPEKEECLHLANQLGKQVKIHGPVSQVELAKILN